MNEKRSVAACVADWSEEEDATLTREWKKGKTVKQILKLLPLRTPNAVRQRRLTLNLPLRRNYGSGSPIRSTAAPLWAALKKRPGTRDELAARARVGDQAVTNFIRENRAAIHVCGWKRPNGGRYVEIFKAGAGVDVPKPPPLSRYETYSRWWKKLNRERPEVAGQRIARDNHRRLMRQGKLVRRDVAAQALFGDAPRAAVE